MTKTKWKNLKECADFKIVFENVKSVFPDENCKLLDRIENDIKNYLNASDEEWQNVIESGKVPISIKWYCGMIDTQDFLEELKLI